MSIVQSFYRQNSFYISSQKGDRGLCTAEREKRGWKYHCGRTLRIAFTSSATVVSANSNWSWETHRQHRSVLKHTAVDMSLMGLFTFPCVHLTDDYIPHWQCWVSYFRKVNNYSLKLHLNSNAWKIIDLLNNWF